ncbi:hypothetical protein ACOACO_16745 [Nocardioides sp. CPCC 205120]|uniref:hypothetical protein n=1 Tax=Nocardioides sp. CPCC 205120 TaxID=3406462 RepID=UPI003B510AF7
MNEVDEAAVIERFRNAAGRLVLDGEPQGYVTTYVRPYWSIGHPFRRQVRVWFRFNLDGGELVEIEDYGPGWWTVREALRGVISIDGETEMTVTWLEGAEREQVWAAFSADVPDELR